MTLKNRTLPAAIAVGFALLTSSFLAAQAPDTIAVARGIVAKDTNPVINVGAAVKVSAGMMGDQEDEVKTTGVVLDASGLTAVSRRSLNPMGYEPITIELGPGMEETIEAEVTSTWLQLRDGTRIAAEVVLTDPDLDLSFLRPIKAADAGKIQAKAANYGNKAKRQQILDQVIVLSRLGKTTGHTATVKLRHIEGIVETPWTGYLVPGQPGDVVYAANGQFLGLIVSLPSPDDKPMGGPMAMMGGPAGGGAATAVLPATKFEALIAEAKAKPASDDGDKKKQAKAKPRKKRPNMFAPPEMKVKKGDVAPTFALIDDKGQRHDLADYAGKHVLLDWWGTW